MLVCACVCVRECVRVYSKSPDITGQYKSGNMSIRDEVGQIW